MWHVVKNGYAPVVLCDALELNREADAVLTAEACAEVASADVMVVASKKINQETRSIEKERYHSMSLEW